jgi:hippurate hydrolase
MYRYAPFAAALFLGFTAFAQPTNTDRQIAAFVDKSLPELVTFYKDLHASPEVSFMEKNTSAKIAAQLRQLGFTVTENLGGYGVVGVLRNGTGPTVLVRTDLDALPVPEQTGLPYASKVKMLDDTGNEVPAMHACGHDLHMTVFTGVARTLTQFKDNWKGTVVLIGQPAEERSGGAIAMLKEGLYKNFPRPDFALALHTNATIAAGKVGYTEGPIMANVDAVDITVNGVGGHGALPHTTRDPIVLASQIVLALQTIVSRQTSPFDPCVVTVGSFHGGKQFNIIPDKVELKLTLRSYSEEVRNQTIESIKRIIKGTAEAAGVPQDRLPAIKIREPYTPSTINDIPLTRRLTGVFSRVLGKENVVATPPSTVGEDFSRFGREEPAVPICMYWLGAVDPKKIGESQKAGTPLPSLHSSIFAPLPEPAIKAGIQTMSAAVMDLLKK